MDIYSIVLRLVPFCVSRARDPHPSPPSFAPPPLDGVVLFFQRRWIEIEIEIEKPDKEEVHRYLHRRAIRTRLSTWW